ncbi:putative disease resistance protein RGA3 [Quercus robur]|uniref:putative disease resistance protein RGA3 n=1 Tax=Quercus robur TaxID=38942 RepID=UPI002161F6DA|nr:putative disease resistance protein RGA3 [Quercus robur]XP_050289454.1 putative disease resistance protein RGA3 [Quercus robur]XP_050289455.1 putative disease resistance protein RGA3 [Quercus robur]XP_050289456.1 putative disease resistance protein RGA3 [Quercus robur]XP_050289457.1 putative disease resistance protein RGA3 [Quercus robur]XP_050289458.1 putative disease resistance protein RGA3 [Quercus robur]XP_050289459.1 putative disease resistance protein RGA3 [Quercus robur]XP_05028946
MKKHKLNRTIANFLLSVHFLLCYQSKLNFQSPLTMAADALLTDLFKQLASTISQLAKEEIKLLGGVDDEVEKLQDKLGFIKAMMDDAEERHAVKQHTGKLWLAKLQDKYYEMDDVLDTWSTARIKAEIEKEEGKPADVNAPAVVKKKVCSFFPSPSCCFNLPLRHNLGHNDLGHKIRKLNEKLDEIFNDRVKYGIDFNRQPEVVERPITTSFVDESDIIGRDNYREELLSNLLGMGSPKERNPRVISLVGMGGLGKTTLAQIAYNHSEVKAHFEKRIWVCVSDPFDQYKVANEIIECLEGQPPNDTELQSLLVKLCSLIRGKRFFLVLDDVWTEDFTKWEPFRNALKCGAEGSRILVTTRKTGVVNMMESSLIIDLGVLSINDCWLIIKRIAFSDDYGEQYRDLEELGKQLANKCKGLPLAAKILGSYLRGKMSKKEWEKVLHNDLWHLEDIENGLWGPFFLSYYELSSSEKQCFLFCAVFPEDYEFDKFELIINWMAQGYINSKENIEMEVRAEHYFENLVMRSFFQDFKKDDNDGKIVSCKMHLHDFAKSMAKDVCFEINYSSDKVEKDFQRARQLSLIVKETFPEYVYNAKNLRFFHLNFWSSKTVPPELFDHLTCLRTLHLEGQSTLELPNEVEKLIHLRYLKLSCISLKDLPETVCNLCNLHSLDVRKCLKLEKLPQGMGKLINLRHLLLHDDGKIKSFPKGIGRLTCLRMLTYFPVAIGGEGDEICKLGELKNLSHLRFLRLKFDTIDEKTKLRRRMDDDVLVLNGLESPPRLESLKIEFYMGTRLYPIWMMSLTTLKKLTLSQCLTLECLPPLGKLPLLESLVIASTENVRKVGDEFLGIELEPKNKTKNKKDDYDIVFPNLKFLKFLYLDNWEEWKEIGAAREEVENGTLRIMPHLQSLRINYCPKLKSLPGFICTTQIPSLYELVINEEPSLYEYGIGEEWDKISQIPNVKIGYRYVQRDGHEVKSLLGSLIDSKEFSHPKYQH